MKLNKLFYFVSALLLSFSSQAQSKKISELNAAGTLTSDEIDSSEVVANVGGSTYRVKGFNYRYVTGLQESILKNGNIDQNLYIASANGKFINLSINDGAGYNSAHLFSKDGYYLNSVGPSTTGTASFGHFGGYFGWSNGGTSTVAEASQYNARLYAGTSSVASGVTANYSGILRFYSGTPTNYWDWPTGVPTAGKSFYFTDAHTIAFFTPLTTADRDTILPNETMEAETVGHTTTLGVNIGNMDTTLIGYKEYTCTLTDYGTDPITSGNLHPWETYTITSYSAGDDFSAVATVISGTINTTGCVFICTGTTPTNWSNGSTLTPAGNPVPRVLKNTLGIFPKFTRVGGYTGHYLVTDAGGHFTIGNTTVEIGTRVGDGTYDYHFATNVDNTGSDNTHLYIHTYQSDGVDAGLVTRTDSFQLLENTFYSIKVYY